MAIVLYSKLLDGWKECLAEEQQLLHCFSDVNKMFRGLLVLWMFWLLEVINDWIFTVWWTVPLMTSLYVKWWGVSFCFPYCSLHGDKIGFCYNNQDDLKKKKNQTYHNIVNHTQEGTFWQPNTMSYRKLCNTILATQLYQVFVYYFQQFIRCFISYISFHPSISFMLTYM